MEGPFDAGVVGAGMGGAAFALAAARAGWRVAVVEREPARRLPRPEVLWGPSMRALDELGVGDAVRSGGAFRLRALRLFEAATGRGLLSFDERTLAASGAEAWATDPARTRGRILEAAVGTGGVEVFRGASATGLLREGLRVVGVEALRGVEPLEVRAPFVVGDDGAGSVVRRAAGIGLEATRFPLEFILALADRPMELPVGEAAAFLDPRGLPRGLSGALLVPVAKDRVGLVVPARVGTFARFESGPSGAFGRAIRRIAPAVASVEATLRFPDDFAVAERPVGHAEAYGRPGVACLGDAVHPVSPVGGQGANMALADAVALAAAVLPRTRRGTAPDPGALSAYEAARRPANERSLVYSRRAALVFDGFFRFPALARLVPPGLRAFDRASARKARFLRRLSRAFAAVAPAPSRRGKAG